MSTKPGQPHDVSGTWEVELRSSWVDPETKKAIPPIRAFMAVRQTFSHISLRLMTPESASETLAARVIHDRDDTFRIAASYRNEPKAEFHHRSNMHLGAMLLSVNDDESPSLTGTYWTERLTKGDIYLAGRRSRLFHTFQAADAAAKPPGAS
ncbi:MAG: hypothetical protein GY725_20450 [bacterium]|nr:hypothetical protein [bacterium]